MGYRGLVSSLLSNSPPPDFYFQTFSLQTQPTQTGEMKSLEGAEEYMLATLVIDWYFLAMVN